jgi:hypothetical protein
MAHNIFYLPAAHTTVPLITAVTGIATIVKVLQNFELRARQENARETLSASLE